MTFTVPIFIKLQQEPHRNKLNEAILTFENFSYTVIKFNPVLLHRKHKGTDFRTILILEQMFRKCGVSFQLKKIEINFPIVFANCISSFNALSDAKFS